MNNFSIYRFDNILSTNTYIKENIDKLDCPSIIVANKQEAGCGRFNRVWISTPGKDLTFSLLFGLEKFPMMLCPNITQIVSLSIVKVLEKEDIKVKIKWPNDLLLNGKKVCGILCEIINNKSMNYVIIGIGLNVNSSIEDLSSISQPVDSLFNFSNNVFDLDDLLKKISNNILLQLKNLEVYGFSYFKNDYENLISGINRPRNFFDGKNIISGIIKGINDDGNLLFENEKGVVLSFNSGELSSKN